MRCGNEENSQMSCPIPTRRLTLQESVQGSFFNQDSPPLPLAAHAVMREKVILAPAVDQAGRNQQPFRNLFDRQHRRSSHPIRSLIPMYIPVT